MLLNSIFYLLLAAVLIACLYLTLLSLPGLWVMVAGTVLYAVVTGFAFVGIRTIIAVVALALIAEIIEFFAGAAGAKRAGASRRGLVGALVGGIVGGIALTIFLPVIFTIVGICVGTFAGAIIGELWGGTEIGHSVQIGFNAAWGRLLGIITKLLVACVILATVLIAGFPGFHRRRSVTPLLLPSTMPSTLPAKA